MCQVTGNDIIQRLTDFISCELSAMSANITNNYQANMTNRENNPFLCFEDNSIKKYMALGRSVDSQLGNRLQRIIFFIARLKFTTTFVPNIVFIDIVNEAQRNIKCTLYSVSCDLATAEQRSGFDPYRQFVCVGMNKSESAIKDMLKIRARSNGLKQITFEFKGISRQTFDYIKSIDNKKIPVDLLCFACSETELKNANTFEIKMGGNLDTKNAKSNAAEVIELKKLFSFLQTNNSYFATCYGECSQAVSSKLDATNILNNRNFWEKIIPSGNNAITYEQFIDIFKNAFVASGLEHSLQLL